MVFKALNGLAPEYLSNLFIRNSESPRTSSKKTGQVIKLQKAFGKIVDKIY